ncbi:jg18113 [Pararge aegeria aegeria]|uniref:Jg18113 protein n=1 Tax=Pararge aegeria aegeria TaxID=348720 RepID=A0A8S4QJ52_9NEOP|nr:jg18113 [Pararge aegeria aegeria]
MSTVAQRTMQARASVAVVRRRAVGAVRAVGRRMAVVSVRPVRRLVRVRRGHGDGDVVVGRAVRVVPPAAAALATVATTRIYHRPCTIPFNTMPFIQLTHLCSIYATQ